MPRLRSSLSLATLASVLALALSAPVHAGRLDSPSPAPAVPAAARIVPAKVEVQPQSVLPYAWHQRTLANGLRVIVIPMPTEGLAAYRTVVRTGARDEYEKGATGFAHFFEHMMFRGTERFPAEKYGEIVTRMGADSNAYTSTDMTVYEFDIASEDLPTVVEIEADRFMNLDYKQADFKTEAGAVYGEYRKNRSNPFFVLYEAIHQAAFSRHTYGHTAMGLVEDIKAMPGKYAYSRRFFKRYYRPENCVIVVAGDVEPEATFALVEAQYKDWKPGYVAPKVKPEPLQTKAKRLDLEYEGQTLPKIWIGYKGGAFAPEDRVWVASQVLAELAFGETSDIYRELILERQVVQGLGAGGGNDRDPGLWSIYGTVKDPADIDAVIERIDQTVARYTSELPDPARVDAVRSHMRYDFLLGLDTSSAVAGELASFIGVADDLHRLDVYYENLVEVTPEDIQAAAQRWLVESRRTVAVIREAPPARAAADDTKGTH